MARLNMDVPKERNCLKCGEKFMSEGRHNRLCTHCNRSNLGLPKLEGKPVIDGIVSSYLLPAKRRVEDY